MSIPSILITGATGFVGAAFVRHFARLGWDVTGTGRGMAPAAMLDMARFVKAEIRQPLILHPSDVVVHAAALASDAASLEDLRTANLNGTRHVFEATRDCKTFVYISSSSVYDFRNDIHDEDEPVDLALLSYYGRSKRESENWLLAQDWRDRTLIILRPRAIYGPGDRMLLPRLLQLMRNGRIVIPGDMRVQSSLTHVDNLCEAAAQCLLHHTVNDAGGVHVFNVVDAAPYLMRDAVQQLLSGVLGRELAFRSIPLAPLKVLAGLGEQLGIPMPFTRLALTSVSRHNILNVKKITEVVGYQPTRLLQESVSEITVWANKVGLENVRMAKAELPWMN